MEVSQMPSDLLASLKERLVEQQAIVAAARQCIDDLETAINAIEAKHCREAPAQAASDSLPTPPASPSKPGRGELSRVALECVRYGKGTPSQIKRTLQDRGLSI